MRMFLHRQFSGMSLDIYFAKLFKLWQLYRYFKSCFGNPTHIWSEKAMAPHSSTQAWKIPRTEEPGRLQSTGSLRVGHD